MKNLKLKALSLGIVSTILISSTAFAATNTHNTTKSLNSKTLLNTRLGMNWDSSADDIISAGGTIHEGQQGYYVREVQWALQNAGYLANVYTSSDGIFGNETYNAVVAFQRAHGLSADGIVGSQTWSVLRSYE